MNAATEFSLRSRQPSCDSEHVFRSARHSFFGGIAMIAEPAPRPDQSTHEANGQFARGNPGGSGNPYARKVAALRQALIDSITAEDIVEVGQAMAVQARKGNVPAARLLYSYTLGKPTNGVDPDRLNVDEWQQLKD